MPNNVMSIEWLYAASVRALKTTAQVAIALIVTGTVIWELNWTQIGGVSATALVLSLLTSLAGLPEVTAARASMDTAYYDDIYRNKQ